MRPDGPASDAVAPPGWVKWGVVLLLALMCSLAIHTVDYRPVTPRVLYWSTGADALPIVSANGRGLVGRAIVNPPGRDLVVALDALAVRPRWTSQWQLRQGPRRQISIAGPHIVHVDQRQVHFFEMESGRVIRSFRLPDASDGFCVEQTGAGIWVRLLSGAHQRVSMTGMTTAGTRPDGCRHPLRPHGGGGFDVRHDGQTLRVQGPEWRWQSESRGVVGSWPIGAWDQGGEHVYIGTLTGAGPGIEVLHAETGRHIRRIAVAAGGKVPRFTLYGDTLIVPNLRRWDLYSVETGRTMGQHPDMRR